MMVSHTSYHSNPQKFFIHSHTKILFAPPLPLNMSYLLTLSFYSSCGEMKIEYEKHGLLTPSV